MCSKRKIFWALVIVFLALIPSLVKARPEISDRDNAFAMPYPNYFIYGGCHPDGWGNWCALDVNSNTNGGPTYASINARVKQTGPDDNTGASFLILENNRYRVYYNHGIYEVTQGQEVTIGQFIGMEACIGRCFGEHTHFGVYDKLLGAWIDPRTAPTINQPANASPSTGSSSNGDPDVGGGQNLKEPSIDFTLPQEGETFVFVPPEKPSVTTIGQEVVSDQEFDIQLCLLLVGMIISGVLLVKREPFGFFLTCCLAGWTFFLTQPVYQQQTEVHQSYVKYIEVVWQIDAGQIKKPAPSSSAVSGNGTVSPVFTQEVQRWSNEITHWANEWGLDPNLVATVMQIESCGDPRAGSHAGAMGLFQVMPFHFASGEDSYDPNTNAYRGMAYLKGGLNKSNGDPGIALAGYNGGHSRIFLPQSNWAYETQRYYYWGTGIYEEASNGQQTSERLNEWLNAGGASLCRQAANRLGLP
jgi:hypothetical protein